MNCPVPIPWLTTAKCSAKSFRPLFTRLGFSLKCCWHQNSTRTDSRSSRVSTKCSVSFSPPSPKAFKWGEKSQSCHQAVVTLFLSSDHKYNLNTFPKVDLIHLCGSPYKELQKLFDGSWQQRGSLPHSPECSVEQRACGWTFTDSCSFRQHNIPETDKGRSDSG